jgi:hypothetical protein
LQLEKNGHTNKKEIKIRVNKETEGLYAKK